MCYSSAASVKRPLRCDVALRDAAGSFYEEPRAHSRAIRATSSRGSTGFALSETGQERALAVLGSRRRGQGGRSRRGGDRGSRGGNAPRRGRRRASSRRTGAPRARRSRRRGALERARLWHVVWPTVRAWYPKMATARTITAREGARTRCFEDLDMPRLARCVPPSRPTEMATRRRAPECIGAER